VSRTEQPTERPVPPFQLTRARRTFGERQLIGYLALAMALAGLGVDLLLPAFGQIRSDLGLAPGSTAVSALVTSYFVGISFGQIPYGIIADRFGRRPTLLAGLIVYVLGCVGCLVFTSLGPLIVARLVWGLGAAGPRVVTQAMIRDRYEGDAAAKATSMVLTVFVIVPIFVPSLARVAIWYVSWRWIVAFCVLATVLMAIWGRGLPETLPPMHRRMIGWTELRSATLQVVRNRVTVGYTLAQTALYGGFTAFIATSEVIVGHTYHRPGLYPIVFGGIGALVGLANLANTRIVNRLTARLATHLLLTLYVGLATAFVLVAVATGGRPPMLVFVVLLGAQVSCHTIIIPNGTSLAMLPMAAIAGTAASLMGATWLGIGSLLGSVIDQFYDGTIRPLAYGFLAYGVIAFALVAWAENGRLYRRSTPTPTAALADPEIITTELEV
jgi:DHA1 family bicyclomycin/chloramphenicol resistance-like MFS transporter